MSGIQRRRVELAVEMARQEDEDAVKRVISGIDGIDLVSISFKSESAVVDTILPTEDLLVHLRALGGRVIVRGQGSSEPGKPSIFLSCILASNVEELKKGNISQSKGLVRIIQTQPSLCQFDYSLDGLRPSRKYLLAVHALGDLSQQAASTGEIYAIVTTFTAGGTATVGIIEKTDIDANDLIGRSLVIYQFAENVDILLEDNNTPTTINNIGLMKDYMEKGQLNACMQGVIARSSGIFENVKRICTCSGKTLWEEMDAWKKEE